jgi:hypothetical protein
VQLLFDQNSIDRDLVDLGVDVRRISQVTQKSISDAWSILKQLEGNSPLRVLVLRYSRAKFLGKLVALPTQTKQQHDDEYAVILVFVHEFRPFHLIFFFDDLTC